MSENRTFKRFPDNDYTRKLTSHFSNSGSTPVTTHYESPGQVPRRRGQILVFLLLAALLAGAGYLVWNSFIRYEAYGVVEANIVGLSSPVGGCRPISSTNATRPATVSACWRRTMV